MRLSPTRFWFIALPVAAVISTVAAQVLRFDQKTDLVEAIDNTFVIAERFRQELKTISPGDREKMSAALADLSGKYKKSAQEFDNLAKKYRAEGNRLRLKSRLNQKQLEALGRIALRYKEKIDTELSFLLFMSARFWQISASLEREAKLVRTKGESRLTSMQAALHTSADVEVVGLIWKDLIG